MKIYLWLIFIYFYVSQCLSIFNATHADVYGSILASTLRLQCPSKLSFFMYNVKNGEGFCSQRDVFQRVVTTLVSLQTQDIHRKWVLVLPPWCTIAHWSTQGNDVTWSKFFSSSVFKHLKGGPPILEYTEFKYLMGSNEPYFDLTFTQKWISSNEREKKLSEGIQIIPLRANQQRNVHYKDLIFQEFRQCGIDNEFVFDSISNTISFPSICSEKVLKISSNKPPLCFSSSPSPPSADFTPRLILSILPQSNMGVSVFFYGSENLSVPFPQQLMDSSAFIALLPAPKLVSIAETASKILGGIKRGSNGLALHIRRTDFVLYRSNDIPQSIKSIAQQAAHVCVKLMRGCSSVFVLSDAPQVELEEILKTINDQISLLLNRPLKNGVVKNVKLHLPSLTKSLHPGELIMVEQWIASTMADVFVGTLQSTFTVAIVRERYLQSFSLESSMMAFCHKWNYEQVKENDLLCWGRVEVTVPSTGKWPNSIHSSRK